MIVYDKNGNVIRPDGLSDLAKRIVEWINDLRRECVELHDCSPSSVADALAEIDFRQTSRQYNRTKFIVGFKSAAEGFLELHGNGWNQTLRLWRIE